MLIENKIISVCSLIKVSCGLVLIFSLNSCTTFWNIFTSSDLKDDVNYILNPHKLNNAECQLPFGSRMGTCVFDSSEISANQLASHFELQKYDQNFDIDKAKYPIKIPRLITTERGCELLAPFDEILSTTIYQSSKDDNRLILNSGRFDYLVLYHHNKTNKSCIQVSYSYG